MIIKLLVFTTLMLTLANAMGGMPTCELQGQCLTATREPVPGSNPAQWTVCLAYGSGECACTGSDGGCSCPCNKCSCTCSNNLNIDAGSITCGPPSHVCCGFRGDKEITTATCPEVGGEDEAFCCNEGKQPQAVCCKTAGVFDCADCPFAAVIGDDCNEDGGAFLGQYAQDSSDECVCEEEPAPICCKTGGVFDCADCTDATGGGCNEDDGAFLGSYVQSVHGDCDGIGVCDIDNVVFGSNPLAAINSTSCDGTICCQTVGCDAETGDPQYAVFGFKDGNAGDCCEEAGGGNGGCHTGYDLGGGIFGDCSTSGNFFGQPQESLWACDGRNSKTCQWRVGPPPEAQCAPAPCPPPPAMNNEEESDKNEFGIKSASEGETAGIYIAIIVGASSICIIAAIFIYGLRQKQQSKINQIQMEQTKNNENEIARSQTVGTPASPVSMESNQSELNVETVTNEAINEL